MKEKDEEEQPLPPTTLEQMADLTKVMEGMLEEAQKAGVTSDSVKVVSQLRALLLAWTFR